MFPFSRATRLDASPWPDIFRVLNTPGVQQVLGTTRPEPIESEVIESLRTLFSTPQRVHPGIYLETAKRSKSCVAHCAEAGEFSCEAKQISD